MISRKLINYFVRLFIGLLIILPTSTLAGTITLITGDFVPYTGSDLLRGGMITEIVVRAFKEIGRTPLLVRIHKTLSLIKLIVSGFFFKKFLRI